VDSGRVGVIFVIPGRDTTLRVNGRACVTARPDLLERLTAVGKPPRTAIVVEAEEVYAHCPKAFVRSKLWDPASWLDPATLPTAAEVSVAHRRDPGWTVEQEERRQADALLHRLD
jgi:predicted pyridoxine 5'-phosphate oxidase superfamily flavin-nucleotide-binding protein